MEKPIYRRWLRWAILLAALAALALQLLFLPLPRLLLQPLAEHSAAWLLNDQGLPATGIDSALQTLVGEALQQSLVAHFHADGPVYHDVDDAVFAGQQLRRLRPMLINQRELFHNPAKGAVALSGLAWCDMANGIAGRLLAHDFDRVQIVGVRDKATGGGHSFGRFWSRQYNDWLYFDIWAEEIFVFRAYAGNRIEYLYRSKPLPGGVRWPEDVALVQNYHKPVKDGFVHNELQASLGSYFGRRVANLLLHGSTAPAQAAAPLRTLAGQSSGPSGRIAPKASSRATAEYAGARVQHFLGNRRLAIKMYRQMASLDRKESVYGYAALVFADRLDSSAR